MRPWNVHVEGKNIKKADNNGQEEQIMAPFEMTDGPRSYLDQLTLTD